MRAVLMHNLPPGGARRVMVEHVARFTWDITEFCLSTALPVTPSATIVELDLRAPRAPAWQRPPLRYGDHLAIRRAWRTLARLVSISGPDVVLAHPCRYENATPALVWLDSPSVYFCHEPRRVDYEPEVAGTRNRLTAIPYWPLHRAERRGDRRAVASASSIVTNSVFSAGQIEAAYGRTPTPIPLGVSTRLAPLASPAAPRHILSVGALTAAKGHELVIGAAALTRRPWPVVIVTPRENAEQAEILRRLAKEREVDVTIAVAVSDAELARLYQHALATLYLARAEPYGLVSIEAQACGSPVIVAAEGGLPETVIDGSTGWVVPRSAAAAAARLDLLGDESVRAAMVTRAAAHGAACSWERSARMMQDIMEAACGARGRVR